MHGGRLHRLVVGIALVLPAGAVAEEVRLSTPTGALHGMLDLPDGRCAPCPVMVVIAGSGPTDRDGNQPALAGDSLKHLGHALAQRGIAALRYDKRGVGTSRVAVTRESDLRLEHYVGDAAAWIARLRGDARFSRVGVIGHSEGSLIAMLAAKRERVDVFVSIAGPGRPAAAVVRGQLQSLPPALRARGEAIVDELVAAPWPMPPAHWRRCSVRACKGT